MNFYAEIFTDGSCHTQLLIGGWAAVVLIEGKKIVLRGTEDNTTHNRMEILGVINSMRYILQNHKTITNVKVVSDSQYVIGLIGRREKFKSSNFTTKAGNDIRNIDLVKELLELVKQIPVQFIKIKAHQKPSAIINYNIEVDKLAREIVRHAVKQLQSRLGSIN